MGASTNMSASPNNLGALPRGDQNCPLAFIGYQPTVEDEKKGMVFTGTEGWFLEKMQKEAGLPLPYLVTLQPFATQLLPEDLCLQALLSALPNKFPLIATCDSKEEKGEKHISDTLRLLCPFTEGNLDKYAGSLLHSPFISWPHYVIPTQSPAYIFANYSEKDITVTIDYGRIREELEYWNKNGKLQPLPERQLITEPSFDDLIYFLREECRKARFLSTDIETIRPPKETDGYKRPAWLKGHPGYPYTNSFAVSSKLGISYSFWDYTPEQLIRIWREMDWLLRNIPQIGQNYFLFDIIFLKALGFRPCIERCQDTLIRHHILWPELPHSLQFQTRQYTRQPYYKDEGKQWSPKFKKQLMVYNALDTTCTYEVYEGQELDFNDRPHLR